jgi:hypothetical protein
MTDRVRAEVDRSLVHAQDFDPVEYGCGEHRPTLAALGFRPRLGQLTQLCDCRVGRYRLGRLRRLEIGLVAIQARHCLTEPGRIASFR